MTQELLDLFPELLARHVRKLTLRGEKASGLCPFHDEKTPSFTAHLGKGVYYCFGCGAKGGVVAFAKAVGAQLPGWTRPWGTPLHVQRQRLARDAETEFRAWKEAQRLDAVERISEIESTLQSLNACFRFEFQDADLDRLHALVINQQYELLDAIARLDRYDSNPLVDDSAAQAEWVALRK